MKQLLARFKNKLADKHLKDLVKGSLDFFILRVIGLAATYLFIYIVNRWYGESALGIYSLSVISWRVASIYGRVGLDNAYVKFIAHFHAQDRPRQERRVYVLGLKVAIPVSLAASVILYFCAPVLVKYVFTNTENKIALLSGIRMAALVITPGVLLYLNAASLRARGRMKGFSFLINVAQFSFAAVFLAAAVLVAGKSFMDKNTASVAAFALATIAAAIASFVFKPVPSIRETKKTKTFSRTAAEEQITTPKLMKVAFPMLLSGSYTLFLAWTSTIVLGIYHPESQVGVFHVVTRVAAFLTFTLTAVNSISAPKFSQAHAKNDTNALEKITGHAKQMIFWSTVPIGIILLMFPRRIIGIFGDGVEEGAGALTLLLIGYFVNAVCGPVGTIMQMTKHQVAYQNIILSGAVVTIVLSFILVPSRGIEGAAIASAVGMITWNIASVIFVKKKFNIWTVYLPIPGRRARREEKQETGQP